MAAITPEEAQLLAAKLAAPQMGAARGVADFANKLGAAQVRAFTPSASTIETMKDRGDHALGTLLGPATGIGPVSSLAGAKGGLVPASGPGGLTDLSSKAQQQIKIDDLGQSAPMQTPGVTVNEAPTLASQEKPRTAMGGGIPGGNALLAKLRAAQAQGIHTMEQERDLTGQLGVDKAGRVMAVADLNTLEAERQQREADREAAAAQQANDRFDAFMSKQQRMVDDLAASKTDPGRLLRNADTKTQFSFHLGAALNGGLAAMNGTNGNSSLDRMERLIAQDIKSQEEAIDNKKSAISAQNSALGQLIQETGSRSLARQQLRVLNLEAAKTKLQADADRLGIPEIRTNAELMTNAIQQKIDAANTGLAKEAYAAFMAQAAAAAAAQRAAEEKAWQRSMEVAKLGLEKDKLEIEKAKAMGLTGEDLNKQTQALSKELSDKDLAEGRSAVDNAKRRLVGLKDNEGLPGIGRGADLRDKLAPKPTGLQMLDPLSWGLNAAVGLSDEERVSRGDWEKIKLAYQKQITGSGASTEERKMLSQAFEGAKSPAEQRNAINQADAYFSKREAAIKAGFDPRAVQVFEQRLNGIRPELPASVQVKK